MELRAKKSLGQHFLNSPVVLKQIIESARIQTGETVLEIGPGTGVLTKALLDVGAKVIAIEKDSRAIAGLQERFSKEIADGRSKLVEADILDRTSYLIGKSSDGGVFDLRSSIFDPNPLISNAPDSKGFRLEPYALVANIPYYITGAILELFLEHEPRPNRMVLLVQKEVAERITAKPAGNETVGKESILSISVKAFGTPKIIARVPRGAFTPPPTVDSAILSIDDISDKRFKEKSLGIPRFFEILKAGFAHKRKLLIRNLEMVVGKETVNGMTADEKLEKIWLELDLNEKARAEDIALEQWFGLASRLGEARG